MKNFLFGLAVICFVLFQASCTKDDIKVDDNSSNTTNTTSTVTGKWIVTKYQDKDKESTSDYSGFSFEFKSDGTLTASKGNTVTNGTWKIYTDSGKKKFDIRFPAAYSLDELNEDWEIISQSDSVIQLKNVSGGNGGTSYLTFTK